jgi:hypothetical protein
VPNLSCREIHRSRQKTENNRSSKDTTAIDQEKAAGKLGGKPQTKEMRSNFVGSISEKGFF